MRPFEIEQELIAHIIPYGNEVAQMCLPQLTPDKFVFSARTNFGSDHALIWTTFRHAYLTEKHTNFLPYLNEYEVKYLDTLDIPQHFDLKYVQHLAELVDKQGIVFNVARDGSALGNAIDSVENFMQTVDSIADIEQWASDQLNRLRVNMSMQSDGYVHISDVVDSLQEEWADIRAGKVTPIIPCGIPILEQNMLFPAGEIAVVHGLSGSGKSTLVFQVNLGTALNLYVNDRVGCVAINSLEMSAMRLVERLAGILAHVNIKEMKANVISDPDFDSLMYWSDFVRVLPIYIDDTNFLTTTALNYRASGLHVSQYGPVVQLSSDYGELFRIEGSGLSKEERIDKVFREQFVLSRLIGASVIAISQSTNDKAFSGKTYIAGPDGTRYSRGILQSADVLCELWNPEQIEKSGRKIILGENSGLDKSYSHLFIQKYRDGEVGASIPLGWRPETTTFYDMSLSQTPFKETVYTNLAAAVQKYEGVQSTW